MKENFFVMILRTSLLFHSLIFIIIALFSAQPWPSLLLTVAQIIYVPMILQLVISKQDWFAKVYFYFAIPAYIAIAILEWTDYTAWDGWLAAIYFLFTIVIAGYGVWRFLHRGFSQLEEFSIDLGLIYLALGGAWFLAAEAGWDTGFSAMLTWLTAIHFHYSAFLLPIFIGFLGRIAKSKSYPLINICLLLSPMIVALGIAFSRWLELLSVFFYIVGIVGAIVLSWKSPFPNRWQKWLIRISFCSLALTISFSLLYVFGRLSHLYFISISFMLQFHGFLNCVLFALFGVAGWMLRTPHPQNIPTFPVSHIRGKMVIGERFLSTIISDKSKPFGLVDDFHIYNVDKQNLSSRIVDFYEHTSDYRLFAKIQWAAWFRPLASVYRLISRHIQQINLPTSNDQLEMRGGIYGVQESLDGRISPRAWLRKIEEDTAFLALYSSHQSEEKHYMNIALPLPLSTMVGILDVQQRGSGLRLTSRSERQSEAGIYLAIHQFVFKLPLEECFLVNEAEDGKLYAEHRMWICGLPFLKIDYKITQKTEGSSI